MALVVDDWVDEEQRSALPRAVVHRADCRHCGGGPERQARPTSGRWHGPVAVLAAAQATARQLGLPAWNCRVCRPAAPRP